MEVAMDKKQHPITRRACLAGLALTGLAPSLAMAEQAYPAGRTIKIIVGYAPGGSSDIVGRIVADRLAAMWGVPAVVENVAGANGNIGNERVAKGPADGTHLLIVTASLTTNAFLYSRLGYDPERDLTPVSCVARLPNLLLVKKELPVNSVSELIAYARANPGKLNYASPGTGSSPHLSAEIFKQMTGTEMVAVTYRGSGPALNDLVAGTVDVMFDNITSSINLVRDGRIKALAVTSAQRTSSASEYPTIAETVPGFDVSTFFGVAVRAGTPDDVLKKIEHAAIALALDPSVKTRFAGIGAEVVGSNSRDFRQFIANERSRWGKLITDLGVRIE
jgi:tripartite-type tricarboxylate transporter receptor subunit TctC